jgi:hypothetical protein
VAARIFSRSCNKRGFVRLLASKRLGSTSIAGPVLLLLNENTDAVFKYCRNVCSQHVNEFNTEYECSRVWMNGVMACLGQGVLHNGDAFVKKREQATIHQYMFVFEYLYSLCVCVRYVGI